jgi:hypothetical protein
LSCFVSVRGLALYHILYYIKVYNYEAVREQLPPNQSLNPEIDMQIDPRLPPTNLGVSMISMN